MKLTAVLDVSKQEFIIKSQDQIQKGSLDLDFGIPKSDFKYNLKQYGFYFELINLSLDYKICHMDSFGGIWDIPNEVLNVYDINAITVSNNVLNSFKN